MNLATDEPYPPSVWCVSQEWFGQRQALLVERVKLEEEVSASKRDTLVLLTVFVS